ncbi:hypothetical protein [Streptomyces sp. TR02-1]|uniref:hypothetical protein n=1 Tax=Streptomyces sp. TR02-1 TaxID=3385977 RepID=UPI0039A01967
MTNQPSGGPGPSPHRNYGDNDTYGDPSALVDRLSTLLDTHGISAYVKDENAYDLSMTFTGHGAARLVHILEQASLVGKDDEARVIAQLVRFH